MKVATKSEMQAIDLHTINKIGIPGPVLMERAGISMAESIIERFSTKKALIVCGTGNNGGDGLVIARELKNAGYNVAAIIAGSKSSLSPGCSLQLSIAKKLKIPVSFTKSITRKVSNGTIIVDALFGTGANKPVTGPLATLIKKINSSSAPVASVDIPSGISANTGQIMGVAIRADLTVTFGLPKRGHYLYPGKAHTGELHVKNIGFPPELFNKVTCSVSEADEISELLPTRAANAHKGKFGHVLVIAGSMGKTGAAFMASKACLRSGTGLVTVAGPETLSDVYQKKVTEEMYLPLPDSGDGSLSSSALSPILEFVQKHNAVIAIGPGIGTSIETALLVKNLVQKCPTPMVLDADALNCLAATPHTLKKARAAIVITPHPGEMSRLSGSNIKEITQDPIASATSMASRYNITVLLKGAPGIIASKGEHIRLNPTGSSALAKGGSGDVLTGIISSMVAQGLNVHTAAIVGAYVHGLSADIKIKSTSGRSLLASDVIKGISKAFKALEGKNTRGENDEHSRGQHDIP